MLVLKIGLVVLLHNYYIITTFSDAPFFEDDSSLLSKHVDICEIRCFIVEFTRTRYRSLLWAKWGLYPLIHFFNPGFVIIRLILTRKISPKVCKQNVVHVWPLSLYTYIMLKEELNILFLFQVSNLMETLFLMVRCGFLTDK